LEKCCLLGVLCGKEPLQANLFGSTSVICSWGGTGSKRGGYKIIFCDNELDVENTLQVIRKRRKARGYRLTD